MEKNPAPQCTIFHVYAQDNEGPDSRKWSRILKKYPSIQPTHVRLFLDQNPNLAHGRYIELESNAQNWPSYSHFMIELAADPDAQKISDLLKNQKHKALNLAQLSDLKSRENQRTVSLFKWLQPVQRVATVVEISGLELDDIRIWANKIFGNFIEVHEGRQSYIAIVPPFVQAIEARFQRYISQK